MKNDEISVLGNQKLNITHSIMNDHQKEKIYFMKDHVFLI